MISMKIGIFGRGLLEIREGTSQVMSFCNENGHISSSSLSSLSLLLSEEITVAIHIVYCCEITEMRLIL